MQAEERMTYCHDGAFDELVAEGVTVHIERMTDESLFLGIYRGDEFVFHGNIGAVRKKGRLHIELLCNETTLPGGKVTP